MKIDSLLKRKHTADCKRVRSTRAGVSEGRNDLSAFLSLYHLVPFSIKSSDTGALNKFYETQAANEADWSVVA